MWWEQLKDYLSSFIGAFFLLISLLVIPEIKKSRKYWIPIVGLVLIISILGIDKIRRDNKKEEYYYTNDLTKNRKIDSLTNSILNLKDTISTNHSNDLQFQKRLESMFHIIRDSGNVPKISITNNYSAPLKYGSKPFTALAGQTIFLTPGSPSNIDQYSVTLNGATITPVKFYTVQKGKVIFKYPLVANDEIFIHWTQ